jgi:hypothetical protein
MFMLLVLALVETTRAVPVEFAFDRSPSDDECGVWIYRVYRSSRPGVYDMSRGKHVATVVATGAERYTFTLDLGPGVHFVVVTAVDCNYNESGPSNECKVGIKAESNTPVGGEAPTGLMVRRKR